MLEIDERMGFADSLDSERAAVGARLRLLEVSFRTAPVEEMIATLFREAKELGSELASLISGDAGSMEAALGRSINHLLGKHARELRRWAQSSERQGGC